MKGQTESLQIHDCEGEVAEKNYHVNDTGVKFTGTFCHIPFLDYPLGMEGMTASMTYLQTQMF